MRQREDAMEGVSRCALAVPQRISVFESLAARICRAPIEEGNVRIRLADYTKSCHQ
jgi:hypothetical protein